jgi:hypothetical protein
MSGTMAWTPPAMLGTVAVLSVQHVDAAGHVRHGGGAVNTASGRRRQQQVHAAGHVRHEAYYLAAKFLRGFFDALGPLRHTASVRGVGESEAPLPEEFVDFR